MQPRRPKRLDEMPDHGRVLIAHPSREPAAIDKARENLTDYHLSSLVPADAVYVLNLDQILAPITWEDLHR